MRHWTPGQCVAVGALLGLLALGVWALIYTDPPGRVSPRSECCPAQTSPPPPNAMIGVDR